MVDECWKAELMEEETEKFPKILGTYKVLYDLRKRSWYDFHRSQILHASALSSSMKKSAS